MFPITLTIHTISDLQKVQSVLYPTTAVVEVTDKSRDVAKTDKPAKTPAATGVVAAEKVAAVEAGTVKSAAATVATSPTAGVEAGAAQETQAHVTYAEVAKVATLLAAKDRPAAEAVAKQLGVPNFKALTALPAEDQPAAFAKAIELVNAALAASEVV